MSTTVADIVGILDEAYPPYLAESWDKVGLICGDPAQPVATVAFALDCTLAVAEEAVASEVDMLVVHHPLLLRGVSSVAATTDKGRIIHKLIKNDCALFAAHTNADSARPGVSDRLAELVGITSGRPIRVVGTRAVDKWGVHVPAAGAESLKEALFVVGAGRIGNYSQCAFAIDGTGQFVPESGADPTDGEVGQMFRAPEVRVEFVAQRQLRRQLIDALRLNHPYEEPAFDIVEMPDTSDLSTATGLGRVGELPEPMTLADFTEQVARALPATAWGVRAAGDPQAMITRVAVSSGAGDGLLDDVRCLGVDCFVTSDLRHHPVDEYLRAGGPPVIDTAHYASEFPWTTQAAEIVGTAGVATRIIDIRTDPWTIGAGANG